MDETPSVKIAQRIRENVEKAVVGKGPVCDMLVCALVCGGHALIEDVPGTGKTTLVAALARSLDLSFRRIQFTPDLLPSDVTGFTVLNPATGERETVFGGVMANIVMADEINRTSPKTQSSLLEVMQEGQVTIDGASHPVPQPFIVLATQNPVEQAGTYPLPEAQLDRFLFRLAMGYPTKTEEMEILAKNRGAPPLETLSPVASGADILDMRRAHAELLCSEPVADYIVQIAEATRKDERVSLGLSPRGSLALMRAAMARALLAGRDFTLPDDVQAMVLPVCAHRLVLARQAALKRETAEGVLRAILKSLKVPGAR